MKLETISQEEYFMQNIFFLCVYCLLFLFVLDLIHQPHQNFVTHFVDNNSFDWLQHVCFSFFTNSSYRKIMYFIVFYFRIFSIYICQLKFQAFLKCFFLCKILKTYLHRVILFLFLPFSPKSS